MVNQLKTNKILQTKKKTMSKKIVTLGEIMLRLSTPGNTRFVQSDVFDVVYGGGEANVAVSCANYGHDAYFVSKLPKSPLFNNIIEYFIEEINNLSYLCSIWKLYKCNLDTIIRHGPYTNGLPFNISLNILFQIASGLKILHTKFKVFHGDIKTDNILVEGVNKKYDTIFKKYLELYETLTHDKIIDIIESMDIEDDNYELPKENYIVSISDFGAYCKINMKHSDTFGTRYYQAPEIILLGNCTYAVDIWALGCTFFEIRISELKKKY